MRAIFTWDPVDGVDGYNLYLKQGDGEFILDNDLLIIGNEYLRDDLPYGEYQAQVTAVRDGMESDPSNNVLFEIINPSLTEAYKYYRLSGSSSGDHNFVGTRELELLFDGESIVFGNFANVTTGTGSSADYPPVDAFDQNTDPGNGWQANNSTSWVVIELFEPKPIDSFRLWINPVTSSSAARIRSFANFTLRGSHDGVNWTTIQGRVLDEFYFADHDYYEERF